MSEVEKYSEDGSFTTVDQEIKFYKRTAGRPTKYDIEKIRAKYDEYISEFTKEQFLKLEKSHSESSSSDDKSSRESSSSSYDRKLYCKVPSESSFARYIGISTETLHTWRKEEGKEEFSDIIKDLLDVQKDFLLNGAISGRLNPLVAKLLLSKHGIVEKSEVDTKHSGSVDLSGFFGKKSEKKESLVKK